jgi:hypothetical protein
MFVSSNLRFYAGFPSARKSQTSSPLRELTSKSVFGTKLNRNISFLNLTLPAGERSLVLPIPETTVSRYRVSLSSLYFGLQTLRFSRLLFGLSVFRSSKSEPLSALGSPFLLSD